MRGKKPVGVLLALLVALAVAPEPADAQRARARATKAKNSGAAAEVRAMARGRVLSRERARVGVNSAEFVTLAGRRGKRVRGVLKASESEARGMRPNIPDGKLYLREVAAYRVARAIGLSFVPPTILRSVDGKPGSIQLFVETEAAPGFHKIDRLAGEKLRLFDYLIGNDDRHDKNLLYRRQGDQLVPVAIDNGFSLPLGHPAQFIPVGAMAHKGPFSQEARDFLARIDGRRVAWALARSGIERPAIVAALRRLERLKVDPDFLSRTDSGYSAYLRVWENARKELASDTQNLPRATLNRVDRTADWALSRAPGRTSRK